MLGRRKGLAGTKTKEEKKKSWRDEVKVYGIHVVLSTGSDALRVHLIDFVKPEKSYI